MTDEQKARAANELREVDVEFENASLAMMRAFEAFQRYQGALEDAGVEKMPPEGRELEPKYDVAVSLHFVLRRIATRPTGGGAARAVLAKLQECEIERAASDAKAHPPTREAVIAGLNSLIAERERQIHGLVEKNVGTRLASSGDGIATAFRAVRRERDALVVARDIV